MANNPLTISAKQVQEAVTKATQKSAVMRGLTGQPGIGHIHPPIFGYILRDPGNHSISEFQSLATSVAHALHLPANSVPTTVVHDGHVIIGFVEAPAVVVLHD